MSAKDFVDKIEAEIQEKSKEEQLEFWGNLNSLIHDRVTCLQEELED